MTQLEPLPGITFGKCFKGKRVSAGGRVRLPVTTAGAMESPLETPVILTHQRDTNTVKHMLTLCYRS